MIRRPLIYVQVTKEALIGRRVGGSGEVVRQSCHGLTHPRTLMGDFHDIASGLRTVLVSLGSKRWWPSNVLIHLVPDAEGGYTNVELRAFREAGEFAGARQVFLLKDHRPVTDSEVLDLPFAQL